MLTRRDTTWITRTIRTAHTSKLDHRVGATIVVGTRSTTSPNRHRNHPGITWQAATTHAEEAALAHAYRNGRHGTAYIARINRHGQPLPSHPCNRCMPQLQAAGIRHIVYWNGTTWTKHRIN